MRQVLKKSNNVFLLTSFLLTSNVHSDELGNFIMTVTVDKKNNLYVNGEISKTIKIEKSEDGELELVKYLKNKMIGKQTPVIEYWKNFVLKSESIDSRIFAYGCLDSIKGLKPCDTFKDNENYLKGYNRYKRKEEKNG